ITVEAGTGQELQTQSGDITHSISKVEIQNLPIFGLNPIALALTEPGVQGVSARDDFTNGQGFSVNGTRPRANNFLIDGQDNNDNAINGQAYQLTNLEAVAEVTVLTNSYSAEFGRGGGSVTNLTSKGGTNDWHGAAYDIHRNSAVAAIPAELKLNGTTSNPVDIENTFGFAIGGPIKKNKLFIFGATQWDRERQTADGSTLRLPTAAGVATLQSLGPNANVTFLLASLGGLRGVNGPLRTIALGSGRPAVETGLVNRSGVSEPANDRQENVRLDWNASQSDVVTGRYIRDDFNLTPDFFNFPGSLPPYDSQQGGPSYTYGASWVHTFSARAVNEFRFSYTSINFTFGPTSATAANPLFPSVLVTISGSGLPNLGFPTALPQFRAHKNWQYQDALTYTVGSHTLKGGVDISHLQVSDGIPINSRGTLGINAGGGFTSLANFVDNFTGASGTAAKVFGNPNVQPFVTTYAPYVQDTWRIRPNFTLDLGMRYEYWGTSENILPFPSINTAVGVGLPGAVFPAVYALKQQGDQNNFAPRVGFAYTPRFWSGLFGHEKTVIRAGYGIFYDGLFTNILDNTAATSPNAVGGTIVGGSGRGTAGASGLVPSITPTLNRFAGSNTIDTNLRNPLTHQWNFDIQREIPGGFVVTGAYVGTRGERLYANREFNPRINFGPRVNPTLGPITVRMNAADSIYHSAQLKVDRKFTKGLLLRGAYTFSKLIDDAGEVFTTSGLSSFAQDPFNQRGDRGLSPFNRKHRFV
ncbi:MAG: TonB-dependent receptor, partial [Candidatus Acidiferrales bacterium]